MTRINTTQPAAEMDLYLRTTHPGFTAQGSSMGDFVINAPGEDGRVHTYHTSSKAEEADGLWETRSWSAIPGDRDSFSPVEVTRIEDEGVYGAMFIVVQRHLTMMGR